MRKAAIACSLALASLSAVAQQPLKPEKQIELRQSAYALIGYNFGNIAAMAQDKQPYNKDEATRNADFVAMLSDVPKGFFGEGTDKGRDTKAKPEIWQKRADFDAKMDKMIQEAKKLPAAARADLTALKKAVADTGSACKACHDDYRAK
ncbi:MAG: cytochrome c [Usitatibacter sp.]